MPGANNLNFGVDYDFGLYDTNTANIVDLGSVQSINVSASKHDLTARPYNDDPIFNYIPDGYRGTFEVFRTNSALENLQITLNQNFKNGQTLLPGYLNETVQNGDRTVSKYQYTECVFFMTGVAKVSRENYITQTVEFMARNKVQVA